MMAGAQRPIHDSLTLNHVPPLKIVRGVCIAVLLSLPLYIAMFVAVHWRS
jgi:hypothetical protein